jgi:hypothetical protein
MSISIFHRFGRASLDTGATEAGPIVVPADHLTIEIVGQPAPAVVSLDERAIRTVVSVDGSRAYLLLDATRSVGFHLLRIGNQEYCFATEDAKLKLKGIQSILAFVGKEGLSWGHQLFFADGVCIRDSKVAYTWLLRAIPQILALADEISERPHVLSEGEPSPVNSSGHRPLLAESLGFLRKQGMPNLLAHSTGIIDGLDAKYWPRRVISNRRLTTTDNVANRRFANLLAETAVLANSIIQDNSAPRHARDRIVELRDMINGALSLNPFSSFGGNHLLPDQATSVEKSDDRYVRAYELWCEFQQSIGWSPNEVSAPRFAYVAYSDEIFQAFAAIALARAFGAKQSFAALRPRLSSPSFRADDYDVYYDADPPFPEFRNWRSTTDRPAEMRPDLTLVHRPSQSGILMDAKYRADGGRAPSSALGECQVYMHSFGVKAFVVLYYGTEPRMATVSGDGNVILEVSIGPYEGLSSFLSLEARPRIESLLHPLNSSD